jgi:hypothetical protein
MVLNVELVIDKVADKYNVTSESMVGDTMGKLVVHNHFKEADKEKREKNITDSRKDDWEKEQLIDKRGKIYLLALYTWYTISKRLSNLFFTLERGKRYYG